MDEGINNVLEEPDFGSDIFDDSDILGNDEDISPKEKLELAEKHITFAVKNILKLKILDETITYVNEQSIKNEQENKRSISDTYYITKQGGTDNQLLERAINATKSLLKAISGEERRLKANCLGELNYSTLHTTITKELGKSEKYLTQLVKPLNINTETVYTLEELMYLEEKYKEVKSVLYSEMQMNQTLQKSKNRSKELIIHNLSNSYKCYTDKLNNLFDALRQIKQGSLDGSNIKGIYLIKDATEVNITTSSTSKQNAKKVLEFNCELLVENTTISTILPKNKILQTNEIYNARLHLIAPLNIKTAGEDLQNNYKQRLAAEVNNRISYDQLITLTEEDKNDIIMLPIIIIQNGVIYITSSSEYDRLSPTNFYNYQVEINNKQEYIRDIFGNIAINCQAANINREGVYTANLDATSKNYTINIEDRVNSVITGQRLTLQQIRDFVKYKTFHKTFGRTETYNALKQIKPIINNAINPVSINMAKQVADSINLSYKPTDFTDILSFNNFLEKIDKKMESYDVIDKAEAAAIYGYNIFKEVGITTEITSARKTLREIIIKYATDEDEYDFEGIYKKNKDNILKDYFKFLKGYITFSKDSIIKQIFKDWTINQDLFNMAYETFMNDGTSAYVGGKLGTINYSLVEDLICFYYLIRKYDLLPVAVNQFDIKNIYDIDLDKLKGVDITLKDLWGISPKKINQLKASSATTSLIYMILIQIYCCVNIVDTHTQKGRNDMKGSTHNLTVHSGTGADSNYVKSVVTKAGLTDFTEYCEYFKLLLQKVLKATQVETTINQLETPISVDLLASCYIDGLHSCKRSHIAFPTQVYCYHPDAMIQMGEDSFLSYLSTEYDTNTNSDILIDILLTKYGIFDCSDSNFVGEKPSKFLLTKTPFKNNGVHKAFNELACSLLNLYTFTPSCLDLFVTYLKDNAKEGYEEENIADIYLAVGLPSSKPADEVEYPKVISDELLNKKYTIELVLNDMINGENNSTTVRDLTLLKIIINTKLNSIIESFAAGETTEEEFIKDLVIHFAKIMKRHVNFDRVIDTIKNSIKLDDINKDKLMLDIKSILNTICSTDIEFYLLLNKLRENIALAAASGSLTDVTIKQGVFESAQDVYDKCLKYYNEFKLYQAITPYISGYTLQLAYANYQQAKQELSKYIQEPVSTILNTKEDHRKRVKNNILYRKYLETGNEDFLKDIDYDYISFDLLTFNKVIPNSKSIEGVQGTYSLENILVQYGILTHNDTILITEYNQKGYYEVLKLILAENPGAYNEWPQALKDYYDGGGEQ